MQGKISKTEYVMFKTQAAPDREHSRVLHNSFLKCCIEQVCIRLFLTMVTLSYTLE